MIFVLDTNVLWEPRGIRRLSRATRAAGFRLQVSALVHAERTAQLRRAHRDNFDIANIQSFIVTHGLEVVPFDRDAAERYAERIATRYPDDESWHAAKRDRCAKRLQISAEAGAACPATVDWFIAHGRPPADNNERVILVTNDKGSEHHSAGSMGLTEAIELAEAAAGTPPANQEAEPQSTEESGIVTPISGDPGEVT